MRHSLIALLSLVLFPLAADAAEPPPFAVKAFDAFEALELDGWSYTVTTTSFRKDAGSGDVLPISIRSRVRGRAFLVKSLDEDVEVDFSDFERAP